MFLLRLVTTLVGIYAILMASVFNRYSRQVSETKHNLCTYFRREKHALLGTKATLQLLKSQSNYGTV